MLSPQQSAEQWKIVFYIASSVYLAGAITYGLCASGEVQPWAETKKDEKEHQEPHVYDNKALQRD